MNKGLISIIYENSYNSATKTRPFYKEDLQMANRHMKKITNHLENIYKSKLQWDILLYLYQ